VQQNIKKILIIRFSSIGDIVLTTPIIRCARKQLNTIEIHYLTKLAFKDVINNNPYIDKIFTIDKNVNEVIKQLRAENYDHIVDLHKNIRSKLVIRKLGKSSSGFNKLNLKKYLAVNFKINWLPDIHIVDRYFMAVKRLGIINDNEGLDFFTQDDFSIEDIDLPPTHKNGYIGFVIGGKHNTKMLPEEIVTSICKKIDSPVVLIGGMVDKDKGERIKSIAGDMVFNACGRYSLVLSALLVKNANKIITNDTGLMHIAAAYKKEIVSVWGNTIPAFGMYPYLPERDKHKSSIIEVKGLKCRPCSKIGYKKCPDKHFKCMLEIDQEKIINKLL